MVHYADRLQEIAQTGGFGLLALQGPPVWRATMFFIPPLVLVPVWLLRRLRRPKAPGRHAKLRRVKRFAHCKGRFVALVSQVPIPDKGQEGGTPPK